MFENIFTYHFFTIMSIVVSTATAVSIGQGFGGKEALKAIMLQPSAASEISRTFMLGMALVETSAIFGLTMGVIILNPYLNHPHVDIISYTSIGIALAVCIAGAVVGLGSSYPARAACYATARQPFFAQKIQMLMLLTQSIMQTPLLCAFIIGLLIRMNAFALTSFAQSMQQIAAGLCIGLASIGPTYGLAIFAHQVCTSIGRNRTAYPQILSFTLISEAIIESPLIFALIVSLMILNIPLSAATITTHGYTLLGVGIVMGLGTFGVGIGSGKTAAQACQEIEKKPEYNTLFSRTSLIVQVLIETCAIYTFLIALSMLLMQ